MRGGRDGGNKIAVDKHNQKIEWLERMCSFVNESDFIQILMIRPLATHQKRILFSVQSSWCLQVKLICVIMPYESVNEPYEFNIEADYARP